MPYSIAIVGIVLAWTWVLAPRVAGSYVVAAGAAVIGLTVLHDWRRREWGLAPGATAGASRGALVVTVVAVLAIVGAGAALGTLHDRRDFLGSLGPLVIWGAAQQWVLQTVLLREAQRATSRRAGILLAAVLFAVVHLPNPVLTALTFGGALLWCAIYDRHPTIVPLAISHALATLALRYAFDAELLGRLRVGAAYLDFVRS